jgi:uroporphyrinogen-III synthase
MRVLVTRPIEDANETAMLLKQRGHEALVAPMLTVIFHEGAQIDLHGVQAILATSANGVRALSRRTSRRDLPLFAVGRQTARAAGEAGFKFVRSADGDAAALAQAVPFWTSAEKGPLLHASGVEGENRLAMALSASGYTVRTEYLYEVRAATELTAKVREALTAGLLDAVLLFSPRSARIFADCVDKANLTTAARRLIGVCISEAAAAELAPLALQEIRIAKLPNLESMLDSLG